MILKVKPEQIEGRVPEKGGNVSKEEVWETLVDPMVWRDEERRHPGAPAAH